MNSPDIKLDERQAIYVTSIPGCTRWFELPDTIESLSLDENSSLEGDNERIIKYGQQKGVGAIVKCYCGVESKIRVCDLVEIIGILEVPEETNDREVILHAVTIQPRSLRDLVLSRHKPLSSGTWYAHDANSSVEISRARDLFVKFLSTMFEGDTLAAESLLLSVISSITHRNPTAIGTLSMDIYSTPTHVVTNLTTFLRSVLPAVAVESISVDGLNSTRLYPNSDGERFSAGRGQFVARTTLVIDESNLQEGKLQDIGRISKRCSDLGVRNLRFLSRMIAAQKLSFEFPYYEFEIDTDLSILVMGESKSILPVSLQEIIVMVGHGRISSYKK
jgi:hypothetical protein